MPTWLLAILVIGGSTLLAVCGVLLLRRWVPLPVLRENNEVAGFLIAVLGVAYGVLLAFVVLTVWTEFEEARNTVDAEANAAADMYRLAQGFPEPSRLRVQAELRDYARVVVQEEWEAMGHGGESDHAWSRLDSLWQAVRTIEPRGGRESALYSELLQKLEGVNDHRRTRLLDSRSGLHPLVWVVLICGASITVLFTYFFGLQSIRAQALMTAALTASIALNLFLTGAMDYPFRGDIRVGPEAFERVLQRTMGGSLVR